MRISEPLGNLRIGLHFAAGDRSVGLEHLVPEVSFLIGRLFRTEIGAPVVREALKSGAFGGRQPSDGVSDAAANCVWIFVIPRHNCRRGFLLDLCIASCGHGIHSVTVNGIEGKGRIKDMTFDMYFDYASKAFNAAGYDTEGMTPYEQFNRYGEDFGGRIFENIPLDTTEGFLYYYDDKHHMGGHPWGLVRGSSRTRIYLWPYLTDEGFYFGFSGNEVFMAYEMVKMYMALKGSGMPVKFCGSKKSIIKYLRQDDLIGIVPSYEIALYRQREFPDQNIEDFMHFYPDEDGDIADAIEWQPIMPVILET